MFISVLKVQQSWRGKLQSFFFNCGWISVKLEKCAFNNSLLPHSIPYVQIYLNPFCNMVSVVLLDEIKEHVMHRSPQSVSATLLSDERWLPNIHPSGLFSQQICFKVKSFFCEDTKAMECVLQREQKDVIKPSDRDTMHSSPRWCKH